MSENELAPKGKSAGLVVQDDGVLSSFLDTGKFEQTWRAANVLAKSDLVPAQYRNKPENCFLAFTMSAQVGMNPFTLMQKTYVVQGKLAMEAQLIIALMNTRGPFTEPVQWKFEGQGEQRKCTAYAKHKITGNTCESTVTWTMVKAEGWDKNPKWKNLTDLMFQYRSASFLASLYCPEVKFGMMTLEEAEDIDGVTVTSPKQPESPLEEKLQRKAGRPRKTVESTTETSDPTAAPASPVTPETPPVEATAAPVSQVLDPAKALSKARNDLGMRLMKLANDGHKLMRDEQQDVIVADSNDPDNDRVAKASLACLTTKPLMSLTAADCVSINRDITELTKNL
jgi:hypothetical protein